MSLPWYLPSFLNSRGKAAFDTDAQTYMTAVAAAGRTLTDTEKRYINTLFLAGKSHGWWTKIYDANLFIWGSSTPSRVTFKGVATLTDAASAPTYDATGVTTDGAASYILTDVNPSTKLTLNDTHLCICFSNTPGTGVHTDIGAGTADSNEFSITGRSSGFAVVVMYRFNTSTGAIQTANTTKGIFVGSRTSSTLLTLYKNGASIGTPLTASQPNTTLVNLPLYIGAHNLNSSAIEFSARTIQFWSVGSGLSSVQALDFSTDVNNFLTSMGFSIF